MGMVATAAAAPTSLPSWRQLKAIADGQRMAIFALLGGIIALPASVFLASTTTEGPLGMVLAGWTFLALVIGLRLWMAIAVYRLTSALGSNVAWLWAIGAFLPNLVGLVVLLVASGKANARMKAAGIKVGFMGAKLGDRPPPGFVCVEQMEAF